MLSSTVPEDRQMEISDEQPLHQSSEQRLEREITAVFRETLPLIHIALVSHYLLSEQEAEEMEKDLLLWFRRFCYRPGPNPRENRPFLLVACCQFAREYQKYLVGSGVRTSDEKLTRILDREAAEVARDFSRSLALLDYRGPDA